MADVAQAFIRGHAAAQAEQEHQQQMEENKLRMMVLKHQMDGFKIDTQMRERELAKQQFEMMNGMPSADMPSHDVTTQQPNLPAQSLAGMMTGLMKDRQGMMGGGAQPGGVDPTSVMGTGAQSPIPQTNPITNRVPNSVQFPAVGEQPAFAARPNTLEEMTQAQFAAKMREPYTLNRGDVRKVGGQTIAEGMGAETHYTTPTGMLLDGKPAPGDVVFDSDRGKYFQNGLDVSARVTRVGQRGVDPVAHNDRTEAAKVAQQRFEYNAEKASRTEAARQAMEVWKAKHPIATDDDLKADPPPTYTPPTFQEWLKTQQPAAATKPAGAAPAGPGVGAQVTLQDGRKVIIRAVHPDGSFEYDQIQ